MIPMQLNNNEITHLTSNTFEVEELNQLRALPIFSDISISFLSALSKEIIKDFQIRNFPDVASFAFFCRKQNILKIRKDFENDTILRLGRGIVFHIAPSNVPVNFAYSLFFGVLSGNINIVKVPSKDFEQINIIVNAIIRLTKKTEFKDIKDKIALVKFNRDSSATSFFSAISDVRVIWGGDDTIAQIRKSFIPARSFDVTFADRYSICIINTKEYLKEKMPDKIALGFYNDTYLFDQNACTSPHLINWVGSNEDVEKAKIIFWGELNKIVTQKYPEILPLTAVDKLTTFYKTVLSVNGIHKTFTNNNLLWRVEIDNLFPNLEYFNCSSGYFLEYHASSLSEIAKIISRKYQTIAYYGFEKSELVDFVLNEKLSGVDRIVQIGQTTEFSAIWDGFDLIRTLSRCVQVC